MLTFSSTSHAQDSDNHEGCKCPAEHYEFNMDYQCSYTTERHTLACGRDDKTRGPNNYFLSCGVLCKVAIKPVTKEALCEFAKGTDIATGETNVPCHKCKTNVGTDIKTLKTGLSEEQCLSYLGHKGADPALHATCAELARGSTFCPQYKSNTYKGTVCCKIAPDDAPIDF